MKSTARRAPRLGRQLRLRLLVPVLLIVAATALLGGWMSKRLTDRVFDRWLLDSAHSLAQLVRFDNGRAVLDLPPAAAALLAYDDTDRTWHSVSQGQRLVEGQVGLPAAGDHGIRYLRGQAYDAQVEGRDVRVVSAVVEGDTVVRVAETLVKRQRTEQELLAIVWPMSLLVLAAGGAILLAVRRTVQPLQTIAARWNQRSQASLQPIAADDMPRELLPFAEALNELLARIRAMLERERAFAANAAHQLRTPLAGLQLGLSRAAEAPDLASTRLVLAELGLATQRQARLVQQILLLGRLDPELRGGADFQPTDLVALAQNVGTMYVDAAQAKGVTLELDAPEAPETALRVAAHADLLAEALGNLLENAIRHTPAGGRVLVSFKLQPPTLQVDDCGPGVPEAERQAVFERFVRGQGAAGEGSGLGLAIVRDIARLHDARVALGVSPLGGCRVTIQFAS